MDLRKASLDDKVKVCSTYYKWGFAFLPWLWIINAFWFGPEAFKTGADPRIRKYVTYSAVGGATWCVAIAIWASWFQANRVELGEFGDDFSANYPKGAA